MNNGEINSFPHDNKAEELSSTNRLKYIKLYRKLFQEKNIKEIDSWIKIVRNTSFKRISFKLSFIRYQVDFA